METEYLIVGSGLTGATIARHLIENGRDVLVLDRRSHMGGNVHDHWHPSGIRVHTYGPHYFRTSNERIWAFVNRFADFYRYEAELLTMVDGSLEHWPVVESYIQRAVGPDWKPAFTGTPSNFEEASLSKMPEQIYRLFVKGYTEKQWGVPAETLSADLAGRFAVHGDGDKRLKRSKYQGIPHNGYAAFMRSMLDGIPVLLNVDYLEQRADFHATEKVIFTGPIDEYYGFKHGKLSYRGQKRSHEYRPGVDSVYPKGQINTPSPEQGDHVRVLEWKHMMEEPFGGNITGTVLTTETPFSPEDPSEYEYPFPDQENQDLYKEYRALAEEDFDGLLVCGRLGEYRYYDMDQAIGKAMKLANELGAIKE